MDKIIEKLGLIGIVPVLAIDDADTAAPLARTLCQGGLPCAEVTFRTAKAKEAIARMCEACPDMIVGAGTVLSVQQVDEALEAGAKFIVSPGFDEEVVKYCIKKGVTVLPGCATPSDVQKAAALGLTEVKFFPAEAAGGLAMIKSMAAPYKGMKFMPTGGINPGNIKKYLEDPNVIACGGSFMVCNIYLDMKDYEPILRDVRHAVDTMLDMTFVRNEHGINVFKTKMPDRAVYHMEQRGVKFDWNTAAYVPWSGLLHIEGDTICIELDR